MDPISIAMGLAQFAPMVAKWIGGSKAEAAAEKVVGIATAITGKSSGQEALDELKVNPGLVLQFRSQIAAQEVDLDKSFLADRADARSRDVEIRKQGQHNYRADILAFLAVGALIVCVWMVGNETGMEERAVNAIMFIAGTLAACVRDVYSFEFGSSRGSKEKDALLASYDKGKQG